MRHLKTDEEIQQKAEEDNKIKERIKDHPENVEVLYEPRFRGFVLYDFNNTTEGHEGRIRYKLTKEVLLKLLIKYGEFIS